MMSQNRTTNPQPIQEPGDGGYTNYIGGGYHYPQVQDADDVVFKTTAQTITGQKKFGSETDYTTFEADGTKVAVGAATVFKDLVFPITDRTTGTGKPAFVAFTGNLTAPRFAVNDAVETEATELPHDWKEGSTLSIHLHFTTNGANAAATGVKWEVEYSYVLKSSIAGVGTPSQWITAVVASAEATVPGGTPTLSEIILPISTVAIPLGKIGGQGRMRAKRIAATGSAPSADPFLSQVGIHYEADTEGSRAIIDK